MEPIEKLFDRLASGDQAQAFQAYRALLTMVAKAGVPGDAESRNTVAAALSKAMVAKTDDGNSPRYSPAVRSQLARLLSLLAGASEVPQYKELLGDFNAREYARYGLERVGDASATAALVEAAQNGVGPEFRIGAINSLSRRNGDDVEAALKKLATDADLEVQLAALEALAAQPKPGNDELLLAALKQAQSASSDRARLRVGRARVRLAEGLAAAGQKDAAKSIYQSVAGDGQDDAQRDAAMLALQQLG